MKFMYDCYNTYTLVEWSHDFINYYVTLKQQCIGVNHCNIVGIKMTTQNEINLKKTIHSKTVVFKTVLECCP